VLRGMVEEGLKERQQLRERRSYSQASLVEPVDQFSEEEDAPIVDEDIAEAKGSESNDLSHCSPASTPDAMSPAVSISNVQIDPAQRFHSAFDDPQLGADDSQSNPVPHTPVLRQTQRESRSKDRSLSPSRPGHKPPRGVTNTSSSDQADENGSAPRVRHHSPSPEPMNLRPNPPVMPFPQIRGTRLERLFFSAPEHCPSTCKLCQQRCRSPSPSAVEPRRDAVDTRNSEDDTGVGEEDEGFVEGSCESVDQRHEFREPAGSHSKGKQPQDLTKCSRGANRALKCSRPASRQVLTKIVRELEDDFTHYKR
jgi:hypothetical protein